MSTKKGLLFFVSTMVITTVGVIGISATATHKLIFGGFEVHAQESSTVQNYKSVDEFIDSIGLNTHFTYPDTPYIGQFSVAKQKLIDLGVRHIRDGVAKESYKYEPMNELCDAGIKLSTGVARRVSGHDGPLDFEKIDDEMQVIKDHYMNCIESIEGPNEYDLNHGSDPNWKDTIKRFTEAQHNALKADPQLSNLPIIAPSIAWYNAEGIGDMSAWFDYGNSHPYPGGNQPTAGLTENLQRGASINGEKPVIATETGYHTAINNDDEVRGDGQRPISDEASGKYIPRLYANYFNAGVARTYLYEFIDEFPNPEKNRQESNFGILRHDLSEKPAYTALRTLLTILKPGTNSPVAIKPNADIIQDYSTDISLQTSFKLMNYTASLHDITSESSPLIFGKVAYPEWFKPFPHRPDFSKPNYPKPNYPAKPTPQPSPVTEEETPVTEEETPVTEEETPVTEEETPVTEEETPVTEEETPVTEEETPAIVTGIEITKPDQVQTLTLTGQPGEYFVLIWQEVKSYDYESKSDLNVEPVDVQLKLSSAARAELYATLNDSNPEKPYQVYENTNSFNISVGDSISVVRVIN